MRGFLLGATLVGLVWAGYEWVRNPHGHRGGEIFVRHPNGASEWGIVDDLDAALDQAKGVATPRHGYGWGANADRISWAPRRHPLP